MLAHPAAPGSAQYQTAIEAALVNARRQRPRSFAVRFDDQRQRRRQVQCLAYAHQRPRRQQLRNIGCIGRHPGDRAPDHQAQNDHAHAPDAVGKIAGKWAEQPVDPQEHRAGKAQFHAAGVQVALEQRE